MGIIIILLLLIIVFLLIATKNKSEKSRIQVRFDNENNARRTKYKLKEQRQRRHTRIWTVLRFMATYDQLINSEDFHNFEKNKDSYEEAFGRMRKEHIGTTDIETAIRFCRLEHFYGICKHDLSSDEVNKIHQWRSVTIEEEELLGKILKSYQAYWDNVLNSYKRPSARKNRLQYLIDDIEDILRLSFMQKYPTLIIKAKELQNHYTLLINE